MSEPKGLIFFFFASSESEVEDCSQDHNDEPLFCKYPVGPG